MNQPAWASFLADKHPLERLLTRQARPWIFRRRFVAQFPLDIMAKQPVLEPKTG